LGELAQLVVCPGCGKHTWTRRYTKKDGTVSLYPKHYLICGRNTKDIHKECSYNWRYDDILNAILDELKKITVSDKISKQYFDKADFVMDHSNETELTFLKDELKR
jgi:hypothetical protein